MIESNNNNLNLSTSSTIQNNVAQDEDSINNLDNTITKSDTDTHSSLDKKRDKKAETNLDISRRYKCNWEGCFDDNIEDLFNHLKIKHLKDQKDYKCLWIGCQKFNEVSVSKGGVYSHCRTHIPNLNRSQAGEKVWKCQFCKIDFTSMSVYYRHKKKHTILDKKEETSIMRICALSRLKQLHKQNTHEILNSIHEKTLTIKFIDNEILEIIKKYVKGTDCYDNFKHWNYYL